MCMSIFIAPWLSFMWDRVYLVGIGHNWEFKWVLNNLINTITKHNSHHIRGLRYIWSVFGKEINNWIVTLVRLSYFINAYFLDCQMSFYNTPTPEHVNICKRHTVCKSLGNVLSNKEHKEFKNMYHSYSSKYSLKNLHSVFSNKI